MGRSHPTDCHHGNVIDWGDFGPEDGTIPRCDECEAERDRAHGVAVANAMREREDVQARWLALGNMLSSLAARIGNACGDADDVRELASQVHDAACIAWDEGVWPQRPVEDSEETR